jgi:GntR family transcriptional regulator
MFKVNFQSREPVYKQLYENVLRMVSLGVLNANDKLPPVRTLATDLGINPNTVAKAYSMLERDGYIYSSVGRGSFVSDKLSNGEAEKLQCKKQLGAVLKDAIHCGVPKEDVIAMVENVYNGGVIDD